MLCATLVRVARSRRRKWVVLALVAAALIAVFVVRESGPKIADGSWLSIDLSGSYIESPPDGLITRLIEERRVLISLLDNLKKAERDPRIAGVLLRVGALDSGWAQATEIRER